MKTMFKLFAVFALVAGTFSQSSGVRAGGGGGSTYRFKGLGASVYFSSVDESGCIYTDTSVFANEQTIRMQGGPAHPEAYLSIFITQYDACTGTQLMAADGWALLAASDLEIAKKLQSATLNATVPMVEYGSGETFDMVVNLSWTGVSSIGHESIQSQYRFEGCHQKSQTNGTFRLAQVSGSLSDGITEYATAPFVDARIFSSKGGTRTHGCTF